MIARFLVASPGSVQKPGSIFVVAVLVEFAAVGPAGANPLQDHDNSPLTGIFGLPDATQGGTLLAAGEHSVSFYLQTASHSVAEAAGDEIFVADGETTRLEVVWRRGIAGRFELGLELPYLTHQRGGLDSFIDEWHDWFGFPDGARDERPRDALEFALQENGRLLLDEREPVDGIGDLRLLAGVALRQGRRQDLSLRTSVKLPTGDDDRLLGSGAVDVSIGIAGQLRGLGGNERISAFYSLHATYLGTPRFVADRHESLVWQAAFGGSWRALEKLTLNLQASLRSPLYESRVEMLGEAAVSLTVGGTLRLTDRLDLSLGVGEDVKVSSTPDVTFQAALHYRPLR